MGLREVLQNAAVAAVAAVGNIATASTFVSIASVYDTATGDTTITDTDYPDLKIVFTNYKSNEINNTTILSTDQKALIPKLNLEPTPKMKDLIQRNGIEWKIESIDIDPADALWIFQVRKP